MGRGKGSGEEEGKKEEKREGEGRGEEGKTRYKEKWIILKQASWQPPNRKQCSAYTGTQVQLGRKER
jgi:hypothetical protein